MKLLIIAGDILKWLMGQIRGGVQIFSERSREGPHGGEEKRSAETGNWTFEGAFAPETWVGSASQPSTLPLRVKTVATNFYSRGFA